VHAGDSLRPLGLGGDRRHRQGGCVGREHGVRAADFLEPGEQLPLQVEALGGGLDDEVAAGEAIEVRCARDPLDGGVRVLLAPAAALGALRERLADAADAALERPGVGVVHDGLEPSGGRDLRDPGAHRPCADDSHAADGHAYFPSKLGLRFSRKAFMPSTRSSVAIAVS
jgi:hypothetical protein